ncbi:MAG: nucleoside triphosphate pyrophosphohydrolase [bacterium]
MKKKSIAKLFGDYVAIVQRLRKECPWDSAQTHKSIRHSLIEEAYEVVESIDHDDLESLKHELGDLLLHVVLHSIMAQETSSFSIDDVMSDSMKKLIRRHPHVFGEKKVHSAEEVRVNWEKIKMTEGRTSILQGVPQKLPALLRAQRLQEKAAKVGFDWKKKEQVWKKVREEIRELHHADRTTHHDHIEEEMGDLLFALVNYSRFLHVNAEIALRKSIKKFQHRFAAIEQELETRGKKLHDSSLEEMDSIWNHHKRLEKEQSKRIMRKPKKRLRLSKAPGAVQ